MKEIILKIPEQNYSQEQLKMLEINYRWCMIKYSMCPRSKKKCYIFNKLFIFVEYIYKNDFK